ncbi:MAG: hypothetical protein IJ739_02130 [Bacteroidaceae bacterium]|nr:hypothetical protein [Bacteroidaceae bacterium]
MKNTLSVLCLVFVWAMSSAVWAEPTGNGLLQVPSTAASSDSVAPSKPHRLTIGGYGEAVYNYNFYSSNVFRYTYHDRYAEAKGHGRVDLPHAVLMLGYDFGHGWSFGTEIEFEHGGVETAIEIEQEETGEYEKEIERGGEVALEQFWLQKSFAPNLNLRVGHIVVPVGALNKSHLPTEFFGVYRPEGEFTILPSTWHETGVSLWGRLPGWNYEVMLVPSLNSTMFNMSGWVNGGSASAYEFRVANRLAAAGRLDYVGIPGLRLSLSGFVGNTFNNDIDERSGARYDTIRGTVLIGSFDFLYRRGGLVVRGNADAGYLGDAGTVNSVNQRLNGQSGAPYPRTQVGERAYAVGLEAGYNVLSARRADKRLFLFGRYDLYDSFIPVSGMLDAEWTRRQCLLAGVNYYPIPQIAVKAEVGYRWFASQYNNEPFVALGITWSGLFER